MAAGVFHVEFGINDTVLTQALEKCNYASAERIILECNQPTFLDEGCYQRIPMYICLCGVDQEEERVIPRNFYLARLLLEHGANVNLRIPVTFYGSEYLSPGKTPLELLVDFYNDLTRQPHYLPDSHWASYQDGWNPDVDIVIGLNKQVLTSFEDVIENILDLIFIILSNGGDPNMQDENRMTPLHRTMVSSQDLRLAVQMCENGADLNAVDSCGNTPLLALCDVTVAENCEGLDQLSPCSETEEHANLSVNLSVKPNFLHFLLTKPDAQINMQNNLGQTALFHTVIRGDAESAQLLLCHGADPSLRGVVWETRRKKRKLSPLFASFLSIPVHRSLTWQNLHQHLVTAPRTFAHLVDAGYFTRKEVVAELQEYLESDFGDLAHLRRLSSLLLHLMFGGTTSTLSQRATRVLFRQCLIHNTQCLQRILPVTAFKDKYQPEDLLQLDTYDEYVSLVLNRTVLASLVQMLGLPQNSLLNFEVELLLHQMAVRFSRLKVWRPQDEPVGSDETLTSGSEDTSSVEEGDSDLEYW